MKKDESLPLGCIVFCVLVILGVPFTIVYQACPTMIGSAVGRYEKAKKEAMEE